MTFKYCYLYPVNMTISVSLPEDLVCKIKDAAQRDHRSISGQIAFFCDRGMSNMLKGGVEDPKGPVAYGSKPKKRASTGKARSKK